MRFLIPPGKRVLELGCGRGDALAALAPSYGVGVDFSPKAVAEAQRRYPQLQFVLGDVEDQATLAAIEGPFDYIVIADTIGMFEDIDETFRLIWRLCAPSNGQMIPSASTRYCAAHSLRFPTKRSCFSVAPSILCRTRCESYPRISIRLSNRSGPLWTKSRGAPGSQFPPGCSNDQSSA